MKPTPPGCERQCRVSRALPGQSTAPQAVASNPHKAAVAYSLFLIPTQDQHGVCHCDMWRHIPFNPPKGHQLPFPLGLVWRLYLRWACLQDHCNISCFLCKLYSRHTLMEGHCEKQNEHKPTEALATSSYLVWLILYIYRCTAWTM